MPLPSWVLKRDGRQEPFEADKISQALFAATEALGVPNAFLARELTDSALHFLAQEGRDSPNQDAALPTAQIAELVEKVVRELGQPAIAQAFARRPQSPPAAPEPTPAETPGAEVPRAETPGAEVPRAEKTKAPASITCTAPLDATPDAVARICLEAYALQAVFGRDLAAAHEEGLVRLHGLTAPCSLASVVIDGAAPSDDPGWRIAWRQTDEAAAVRLIVDSAERYLQLHGADWLSALDQALALRGMEAILNVNTAEPPRWAQTAVEGPLFADAGAAATVNARDVWQLLRRLDTPRLRLDWHLQPSDFADSAGRQALLEALSHDPGNGRGRCVFVMDRPRQAPHLAEGVDRDRSGVLLEASLNLPAFLARPEIDGDARLFLAKLPSLARMAVRAGVQKRKYLRHRAGALARGFLLDRACLLVAPLGLNAVVHALLQQSCVRSPRSLDFAQEIVAKLMDQLRADSRTAHLDIALDSPCSLMPVADGLTCDDREAAPADQLRVAAALQRLAGRGTAVIHVPETFTAGQQLELLEQAWAQGIVRLRIVLAST